MKKYKDNYSFIAILSREKEGFSIEFPDLPGCLPCTDKDDTDEAIKNAKEALGLHIFGMEQDGEAIPIPTPIHQISCGKDQLPVRIDVFMPSVRDKIKNQFAENLLSLPA